MDEIIELLNEIDLKLRKRIAGMGTNMPSDRANKEILGQVRMKIQQAIGDLLMIK